MSCSLDYCFLGKFTQCMYTSQNPSKVFTTSVSDRQTGIIEGMLNVPSFISWARWRGLLIQWSGISFFSLCSCLASGFSHHHWDGKTIRIFTDIKVQSPIASSVPFLLVQDLAVISESFLGDLFPSETWESEGPHSGAPNHSQCDLWLFLSDIKLFLSSYI